MIRKPSLVDEVHVDPVDVDLDLGVPELGDRRRPTMMTGALSIGLVPDMRRSVNQNTRSGGLRPNVAQTQLQVRQGSLGEEEAM